MANPDDLRLELRSDPRLLRSVRGLVRAWVDGMDLTPENKDEVVLAINEACANAMRHSYQGCCDRVVGLKLRTAANYFECELVDQGRPAARDRIGQQPLLAPHPDEVEPGGLGLKLMYEVFDEVEFSPGKRRGNRVLMRLNLPPTEPRPASASGPGDSGGPDGEKGK